MTNTTIKLRKYFKKRIIITLIILGIFSLIYFLFIQPLSLTPQEERADMLLLEEMKSKYTLTDFASDGCSGNVSEGWKLAITKLSKVFPTFSDKYQTTQNIPFEAACTTHDQTYHQGEGGYVARLKADNLLRNEIISYGIEHTEEIKARTSLSTNEDVLFLYETIAETIYLSVRVGGKPCSGKPYAWGFGYNNGACELATQNN